MALPTLTGSISFLRQPTEGDAPSIALYANDEEVSKLLRMPFPYTIQDAQDWLSQTDNSVSSGEAAIFSICLIDSDEMIGSIELRNINKTHMNAELGYWLAKRHWAKGISTESLRLILRYGFETLGLHRVFACAHDINIASSKLLTSAGFDQEGTMREAYLREGHWHNICVFSLLQKQYVQNNCLLL